MALSFATIRRNPREDEGSVLAALPTEVGETQKGEGLGDYALNDALLAARNNDRICFLNDQREFGAPENIFHIRRTPDTRTCSDTAKGVPLWVESPEVASHLPATDQVRHCLDQQSLAPHIYQTTICSP